jgi:hypothetical protein
MLMLLLQALFTSSVFKGMRGDYFVSQKIFDRLFTRPGLERIIQDIPTNSLYTSVFLARLKTLYHGRVFLGKSICGD